VEYVVSGEAQLAPSLRRAREDPLYKEVAENVSKAHPGELIPSKDESERGGKGRRAVGGAED